MNLYLRDIVKGINWNRGPDELAPLLSEYIKGKNNRGKLI